MLALSNTRSCVSPGLCVSQNSPCPSSGICVAQCAPCSSADAEDVQNSSSYTFLVLKYDLLSETCSEYFSYETIMSHIWWWDSPIERSSVSCYHLIIVGDLMLSWLITKKELDVSPKPYDIPGYTVANPLRLLYTW